jgi:uncharacterized protein YcaQ
VHTHFDHGSAQSGFGGVSNASTQLLDAMHVRGMLRVARRESGIRLYEAQVTLDEHTETNHEPAAMDALVDVIVNHYAPLPAASLGQLISLLLRGVPQWKGQKATMLARAQNRLASAEVGGTRWFWPSNENPLSAKHRVSEQVRLLAPFDPIVWDRRRFEIFWNWAYRFEAYTPAPKRVRGYYALPLLWGEQVIGWANISVQNSKMQSDVGYAVKRPDSKVFKAQLAAELERMALFLSPQTTALSR